MGWISTILVYFIVWWLVFFCVLPWGNQPEVSPQIGHATSAPKNPRLLLKSFITSVISAIFSAIIWFVIDMGLISFRVN